MLSRECSLESPRGGHERRGGPERIRGRGRLASGRRMAIEEEEEPTRRPLEEETAERY